MPTDNPLIGDGYPFQVPGSVIMIAMILKISGISPKILAFLPILAIPLIFSFYMFAKKVIPTKSPILILLAIIILTSSIGLNASIYGVFPHSWAFVLYFIVAALFYDILKRKSMENIILLLIIFIAIHFYYYSIELWVASFCSILSILIFISNKFRKENNIGNVHGLALILLVIMLAFNRMIYNHYLPQNRLSFEVVASTFLEFSQRSFQQIPQSVYTYTAPAESTLIHTLLLIFILIPITIGIIVSLKCRIINRECPLNNSNIVWFYVVVAMLSVAFVDILIYSIAGVITYRYILLCYPLISIAFLWNFFNNELLKYFIFILILLFAIAGPIVSYSYGTVNVSPYRYSEFEPSCNWLSNHAEGKPKILGDQPLIEKYFLEVASNEKDFERLYIDDRIYESIVSPSNKSVKLDKTTDFIALNMEFNIIQTLGWKQYKSYNNYLGEINSNVNLHKIYSDDIVWIMKT
jgi:hypothetical protein